MNNKEIDLTEVILDFQLLLLTVLFLSASFLILLSYWFDCSVEIFFRCTPCLFCRRGEKSGLLDLDCQITGSSVAEQSECVC